MHDSTAARRRGLELPGVSRQISPADFEHFDLILSVDDENLQRLRRIASPGGAARVRKLTAGQMARALLEESRQESRGSLIWSCLLLASSGLMALLMHAPVLAILLAVGGLNALVHSRLLTEAKTDALPKGQSEEEERA